MSAKFYDSNCFFYGKKKQNKIINKTVIRIIGETDHRSVALLI